MSEKFILAIDQGTTNTKAIIIDAEGKVMTRASVPMDITFPQPAWVEQDPAAILESVKRVVEECLAHISPRQPTAIGISNQRETVLAWDRSTGTPLGPAVVWQCRRTADFCQLLREKGLEPFLRERTGLTIDPLFSGTKARWLIKRILANGFPLKNVCLGTVDSWLLWNLTGGAVHATDVSNAARTQLLNLHTGIWDNELLDLFEIPAGSLPEIKHSSAIYGESIASGNLKAGIPIASLIGDSHAALFGQRGFIPGSIKATYGTGSSLMTPINNLRISERGLSSTIAWGLDQITYALEGNISVTGAAVHWFGQFIGASDPVERVTKLAAETDDTGGVYLVPAFVGLGAPHWDESARGLICGVTRGTNQNHVARAVLESITYQVRDVFDAMQEEAEIPLNALLADGGATRNNQLMQFQADILGCQVLRNSSQDVSALGAGFLAGLAAGIWTDLSEISALDRQFDRFDPQMRESRRMELYAGWQKAVKRASGTLQ